MSDEPNVSQGEAEDTTPPPWGEDFNAERAWKTIQAQRDSEAKLKQEVAEFRRLQEDEDYRNQWASQYFDLEDEEEEYEEEPEEFEQPVAPKPDPRIEQLAAWAAEQQYEKDLSKLLKGRELPEKGARFVRALTESGGFDYKALETAVNEWFELVPSEPKKPAPVPSRPARGLPVTDGKPWSELSEAEALARQMEIINAARSQT